MGLGAHLKV